MPVNINIGTSDSKYKVNMGISDSKYEYILLAERESMEAAEIVNFKLTIIDIHYKFKIVK